MKPLAFALLLAIYTLAAPAWAQAQPQACRDDARKLCHGVQPGGGRVVACLQQHTAELGGACREALPQLARCSTQVRQLCGEGRPRDVRSCLQQHREALAGACVGAAG